MRLFLAESEVFTALRGFLLTCVPANTEVIRGQDNRVPMPIGDNFITMIPILKSSRFGNLTEYFDCLLDGSISTSVEGVTTLLVSTLHYGEIKIGAQIFGEGVADNTIVVEQLAPDQFVVSVAQTLPLTINMAAGTKEFYTPTEMTVQLDVHGSDAANLSQIIITTMRDIYVSEVFSTFGIPAYPLYANDPKQIAFSSSEQQISSRWVIDVTLQINAIVMIGQQFFDKTQTTVTNAQTI